MNNIQNYVRNYGACNNNVNFKAKLSPELEKKVLGELRPDFGKKYLARLNRRLEKLPDVVIDDFISTTDGTYIRLINGIESKTAKISSKNGANIDFVEGLMKKDKSGVSKLSEYAFRLFGI